MHSFSWSSVSIVDFFHRRPFLHTSGDDDVELILVVVYRA
jgi:hypothetical protein